MKHDHLSDYAVLSRLLRERLGLRGRSVAVQLAKGRRGFPRSMRAHIQTLIDAEPLLNNPRLSARIAHDEVTEAARSMRSYLKTRSAADRWVGLFLNRAGVIGFNLLLVFGAVLIWLALR